jgi:DNA-binding transcriptional MerR regulator
VVRRSVVVDAQGLPDKAYFKIGEVARICDVKPYVLRYWESEFRSLRPVKSDTKQRVYRKKDVELLLRIRNLLYVQRFTIEGARKALKDSGLDEDIATAPTSELDLVSLRKIKQDVLDLLRLVED